LVCLPYFLFGKLHVECNSNFCMSLQVYDAEMSGKEPRASAATMAALFKA